MQNENVLSEAQWTIVLDLLNREHKQLLIEIRHTDTHDFREQLQERLSLVEATIARIRPLAGDPAGA